MSHLPDSLPGGRTMGARAPHLSGSHEAETWRHRLAGLDLKQLQQLSGCLPPHLKTGTAHLASASGKIQRVQVSAKTSHLVKLRFYKRPDSRVGRADKLAVIVRDMIAKIVAPRILPKSPLATHEIKISGTQACAQGQDGGRENDISRQRRAMRILQLWGNGRARISPESVKRMERYLSDYDKTLERAEEWDHSGIGIGRQLEGNYPARTAVAAGALARAREILHLYSPGYPYPEHEVCALTEILEREDRAREMRVQRAEKCGPSLAAQGISQDAGPCPNLDT